MPTAQPVHVLASSPIGRRLFALAMELFWLRNPAVWWHSAACEPMGELEARVWEADAVADMQDALMDAYDARRAAIVTG